MGKEQVNMADTSELSLSNASNEKFWPNGWWKLFDLKVGIIPLPLFVLAAALIAGLCITGELPSQITTMVVVLGFMLVVRLLLEFMHAITADIIRHK